MSHYYETGENAILELEGVFMHLSSAEESLNSPEALREIRRLKSEILKLMNDIPRYEGDSIRAVRKYPSKSTGSSFNPRSIIHNTTRSKTPLIEQRGNKYKF
ncbi:hypothetical protein [Anaerobacillus sp. 1_MG-2023]|uniref:hypothetical protein n=1 Tax=Anaerobacillus sp. 1_MG-2023 TaxID=3062655 RepID=UPI0026E44B7C|nr:hypothetical protein [Anaerobacillus sp. 1_MG-2023]MDO6657507.1 hypothetical protein [Anaerobacillus sp. 1_MG-2023]